MCEWVRAKCPGRPPSRDLILFLDNNGDKQSQGLVRNGDKRHCKWAPWSAQQTIIIRWARAFLCFSTLSCDSLWWGASMDYTIPTNNTAINHNRIGPNIYLGDSLAIIVSGIQAWYWFQSRDMYRRMRQWFEFGFGIFNLTTCRNWDDRILWKVVLCSGWWKY